MAVTAYEAGEDGLRFRLEGSGCLELDAQEPVTVSLDGKAERFVPDGEGRIRVPVRKSAVCRITRGET